MCKKVARKFRRGGVFHNPVESDFVEARYSGGSGGAGVILEEIHNVTDERRVYHFRDYQNSTTIPADFAVYVGSSYDVTIETPKPVSVHGVRDALLLVFENELQRESWGVGEDIHTPREKYEGAPPDKVDA